MAVDFDFDTSYNDDEDKNDPLDEEFPEEEPLEESGDEDFEDYDEDDGEPKKSNPLRLILLILLILVLLCAACWLLSRFVSIPGFGGAPPVPVQPAPAQDTPTPAAGDQDSSTTDGAVSGESTTGDSGAGAAEQPGDEAAPAEGDSTDSAAGQGESAEGAAGQGESTEGAGSESADSGATGDGGAMDESAVSGDTGTGGAAAEPTDEGIIISTPVPGPTATPGGESADAGAGAVQSCDNNVPPTASTDGPYEAMMGKGRAIVNFDGADSNDQDGTIEKFDWDFGDGNTGSGLTVQHGYTMTGTFKVTLTVTDNCGATASDTTDAVISAATPPSGTVTATPPLANGTPAPPDNGGVAPVLPPVDPALGTAGFCYKVQPGNTLSGIAGNFGISVRDLAFVNGVSPDYYVIAGQGLFIPVQQINPRGPNIYPAQQGETLQSIANQCGVPVQELAHINGIAPDAPLGSGQLVRIPPPWSY